MRTYGGTAKIMNLNLKRQDYDFSMSLTDIRDL